MTLLVMRESVCVSLDLTLSQSGLSEDYRREDETETRING